MSDIQQAVGEKYGAIAASARRQPACCLSKLHQIARDDNPTRKVFPHFVGPDGVIGFVRRERQVRQHDRLDARSRGHLSDVLGTQVSPSCLRRDPGALSIGHRLPAAILNHLLHPSVE